MPRNPPISECLRPFQDCIISPMCPLALTPCSCEPSENSTRAQNEMKVQCMRCDSATRSNLVYSNFDYPSRLTAYKQHTSVLNMWKSAINALDCGLLWYNICMNTGCIEYSDGMHVHLPYTRSKNEPLDTAAWRFKSQYYRTIESWRNACLVEGNSQPSYAKTNSMSQVNVAELTRT